jgi:hypothetical protein
LLDYQRNECEVEAVSVRSKSNIAEGAFEKRFVERFVGISILFLMRDLERPLQITIFQSQPDCLVEVRNSHVWPPTFPCPYRGLCSCCHSIRQRLLRWAE